MEAGGILGTVVADDGGLIAKVGNLDLAFGEFREVLLHLVVLIVYDEVAFLDLVQLRSKLSYDAGKLSFGRVILGDVGLDL